MDIGQRLSGEGQITEPARFATGWGPSPAAHRADTLGTSGPLGNEVDIEIKEVGQKR
jgi:hypothetical protein